MIKIQSDSLVIHASAETLFQKVSNFSNFGNLMPDKVQNWQATENSCSFEITGMASLAMHIEEKTMPTCVRIVSDAPSPFPFELIFNFTPQGEDSTSSLVSMQVEVNAMLQMMVKKPLQNFVNILNTQLKQACETK
ncbi:MAG: hypothetical protein RRY15_07640 [Bacteroidales bacterium]